MKKDFSPLEYYTVFAQRLERALTPCDVIGVFLGINIDYKEKLLSKNPLVIQKDSALSTSNHAVAIKKIDPKTWAFYDRNLGTLQQYTTLNTLIETALKVYFTPENLHKALGTLYTIQVIRKIPHQDNSNSQNPK